MQRPFFDFFFSCSGHNWRVLSCAERRLGFQCFFHFARLRWNLRFRLPFPYALHTRRSGSEGLEGWLGEGWARTCAAGASSRASYRPGPIVHDLFVHAGCQGPTNRGRGAAERRDLLPL